MKYEYQRLYQVDDGGLDYRLDQFAQEYEGFFPFYLDVFTPYFESRYVAYPVDGWNPGGNLTAPQYWIAKNIGAILAVQWPIYLQKKRAIATAIAAAVDNENIIHRTFDAPDGNPDTAFVTAMESTLRSGGRPEELAHIQHLEALRNLDAEMLEKFEPLFLGVIA